MHDDHLSATHSTFDPALFEELVYACVNRVPRGRVTTYGHIARLCHHPKHARHVGKALQRLPSNTHVPWQRIINASYSISSRGDGGAGARLQAARLEEEGVALTQDSMGVWKVSAGAMWKTGQAQSLEDLLKEEGGGGEGEGGYVKKSKEGKEQKRVNKQVVVDREGEGGEEGAQ
ncbi:o6-methylguanine-dna methyltransferase [Nannochloropsis oceanica]